MIPNDNAGWVRQEVEGVSITLNDDVPIDVEMDGNNDSRSNFNLHV